MRSFSLPSDLEITTVGSPAGDAGAVRAAAQLLKTQCVKPPHHLLLELEPYRPHDLMPERTAGRVADRILRGLELAYRADDVAEADSPPLTRQSIAAARPADPEQDLLPHQFLQHRLEITARDPFALGNLGRPHRHLATVVGNVEHCLDCKKQFLGQPHHVVQAAIPEGQIWLSRVSRRTRIGTSGLDAGRSKTVFLPAALCRKCRYDREFRTRDAGEDELRDPVAGTDPYALTGGIAIPCRDQARSLVIGVDHSDSVAEHQPLLVAEAGARQDQRTPVRGADAKGDARRNQHGRHLRLQQERAIDAGVQVETGRQARAPGRETPAGKSRIEDFELDFQGPRGRETPRCRAIRSASRAATSCLVITGQSSIPSASTRWIVLRSPPKVSVPSDTSLARIQSQRLRRRLRRAFSTTPSVSAAKPTTRAGRSLPRWAMVARMSGFSARRSTGGPLLSFFSLRRPAASTRQSATAAAMTATSTGSAASQAASISLAVSTGTTLTPVGAGSCVGPEISTVSAPSLASAAAIACPCLPEEWFEM